MQQNTKKIDRYAVIGNPISHSKSPQIHAEFAKQTNQQMSYEAILAPLDDFRASLQALLDAGYRGINVTVPFKFDALKFREVKPNRSATDAGAANTLCFEKDGVFAYNTDGLGLVRDIELNLNIPIQDKRILLIGAGGAAEGVAHPVAEKTPKLFVVTNRNLDKAVAIVKKLEIIDGYKLTTFKQSDFEGLEQYQFDIIINATSTGLSDTALPIPNSIFAKNCLAYEMMYGRETPFMKQAKANGAQVSDGLGMLVEQAAEAFYIWRGVRPQTAPVIKLLRSAN